MCQFLPVYNYVLLCVTLPHKIPIEQTKVCGCNMAKREKAQYFYKTSYAAITKNWKTFSLLTPIRPVCVHTLQMLMTSNCLDKHKHIRNKLQSLQFRKKKRRKKSKKPRKRETSLILTHIVSLLWTSKVQLGFIKHKVQRHEWFLFYS